MVSLFILCSIQNLASKIILTEKANAIFLNDSGTFNYQAEGTPSFFVSKKTTQAAYSYVGEVIEYTIGVKNTGDVPLEQVTLTDFNADAGSLNCPSSLLAVGDSMTCTTTHTVTQQDIDNDSIVNVVTVSADYNGNELTDSDMAVSGYIDTLTFVNNNHNVDHFHVFPNPSIDKISIEFYNPYCKTYQLVIIDLTGKVVLKRNSIVTENISINTGNISSGLYNIILRGEKIYRAKVIIH